MNNNTQCMARKNMKQGINTQCSYQRKYEEYCGFHKTKRLRIDEPLPLNYKNYIKNLPIDSKPNQKLPPLKLKNNIEILDNDASSRLITLNDYMTGVHLKTKVTDLKYSLIYYNQASYGKKGELIDRLSKHFNQIIFYQPHINKIELIQRTYRQYVKYKIFKIRGPGFFDRSICINDYDFYSCEDKMDIDNKYFISYRDNKNFVYCFDARSLLKLNEHSNGQLPINPYNLLEMPISVIENASNIIEQLKKNKLFNDFEEVKMTPEQQHRDKIVKIFHKLDELDNHTKPECFTKLTLKNLNRFYDGLYDIWYYRAGLSDKLRNDIVPGNNLFKLSQAQLSHYKDKRKVQSIIIGVIDRLISSATNRSDQILGSLYVLTALSDVSYECGQANQFLLQ